MLMSGCNSTQLISHASTQAAPQGGLRLVRMLDWLMERLMPNLKQHLEVGHVLLHADP